MLYLTIINFIIENIYGRIYANLFYLAFYKNNEWKQAINNKFHNNRTSLNYIARNRNQPLIIALHPRYIKPNKIQTFGRINFNPSPIKLSLVLIKRPERDIKIPDTYPHRSPKINGRKSQRSTSFSPINQTPHHH